MPDTALPQYRQMFGGQVSSLSDQEILDRYRQQRYGDSSVDPTRLIRELEDYAQTRRPLGQTSQPVDPSGDGFFDDILDATRKAGYFRPLQALSMAVGNEEKAQRIEQQLQTDPSLQTTNAAGEFIGSVIGGVAPAAAAVINPSLTPAVLGYYGAQAFGNGRQAYRSALEEGEEPNALAEFTVGLGYGTAEFISEKLGLKALQKIGVQGAKLLGKQVLKRAALKDPGRAAKFMVLGGKAAGVGATEESMATVAQNFIDVWYDDESSLSTLLDDVPESALFGAAGGGLVGAVATVANRNRVDELGEVDDDGLTPTDNYILQFARKNLTSKGNLPEPIFDLKIARDTSFKAEMKDVQFTVRDFNKAAKEAYGDLSSLDSETVAQMDAALKGEIPLESLPEPVREPLHKMRTHIDVLSRRLINEGAVEGPIAGVIEENMGTYATRAYRVFDDPDWAKKVPDEVRNRAKAWIRQEFPEMTEQEARRQIEKLLYTDQQSPIAFLSQSKLGSKDLSILKHRKDIAPEIRALMGEYKDPLANYVNSVQHMAQLASNHKFLTDAREQGEGIWFFQDDDANAPEWANARLSAEDSPTMEPLDGLFTAPEIKEAFESQFSRTTLSPWMQTYMKVLGFSKGAKTVGSVMTQARNYLSNVFTTVAQGHLNPLDPTSLKNIRNFSPAFKGTLTNISRGGKDSKIRGEATRQYVRRLVDLGVLDEDVRSGELEDIFQDAGLRMEMAETGKRRNPLKQSVRMAQRLYQGSDNFWKVLAFESELSRYRRAMPDVPIEQLQQSVARIVRNTYPTYSLVSDLVKKNRRNPLIGPFVSFPAEILRTSYHTAKLIGTELSNPATRAIGARRLAGSLTAMSATAAAATASRALIGMGSDEEDDIRRFVAPWQENSQMFFTSKEDGTVGFVDMSYTDPYEYIKKPFVSIFRGEDENEVALSFLGEFLSPFISEEIITQKLFDIGRNTDKRGSRIYNPQDSFGARVVAMATHVAEGLEPGTLSGIRRIAEGIRGQTESYGEVRDPKIEAAAQVTGVRHEKLDIAQALTFKTRDFSTGIRDATNLFTSVARRRGRVSGDEITRALTATQRSRQRLFEEFIGDVQAARRLGLSERQVFQILRESGLSKKNTRAVLGGQVVPYTPPNDFLEGQVAQARLMSSADDRERSMDELRNRRIRIMTELQQRQ